MSMTDPIADMLTRIRNAGMAGHDRVSIPHSKMKAELARILKREGYITDYTTEGHAGKRTLDIYMKYVMEKPVIHGLERASKSSLRQYVGADEIPRVLGGMGIAVLSTSHGIMTGAEARRNKVGGEVLCRVW